MNASLVTPLSNAPKSAVEAGVDYANDEWDGSDIFNIEERDDKIVVSWNPKNLSDPTTVSRERGDLRAKKGGTNHEDIEGTPKEFEKQLSSD